MEPSAASGDASSNTNCQVPPEMSLREALRLSEETVTNSTTGTTITRIVSVGPADDPANRNGIYRIVHPLEAPGFSFSFCQYLLVDDEPLLWETGCRGMFPQVRDAVARVIPPSSLRWISFSHHENDEDGCANEWLAEAPQAQILCSSVNEMLNRALYDGPVRGMKDGEEVRLGSMVVRWIGTPHFPHNWEAGLLFETTTASLCASDLVVQWGSKHLPVRPACRLAEIGVKLFEEFDPSSWSWSKNHDLYFDKLIALQPKTLCCMHGSAFVGEECPQMLDDLRNLLKRVLA